MISYDENEKCIINEADVTEIIPNLWLGNLTSALNTSFVKKHNIKLIVQVMPLPEKLRHPGINYIYIPIKDLDSCYLTKQEELDFVSNIDRINKIILKYLSKGEGILIHCKRGHHRSANLVATFLVRYLNMNIERAVSYINKRRPWALRRENCMYNILKLYYTQYRIK